MIAAVWYFWPAQQTVIKNVKNIYVDEYQFMQPEELIDLVKFCRIHEKTVYNHSGIRFSEKKVVSPEFRGKPLNVGIPFF